MKVTASASGNAPQPGGAANQAEIVSAFDRLLSPVEDKDEAGEQAEGDAPEGEELEASTDETGEAGDEPESNDESESEDGEESEGGDEGEGQTFRVKVDGEEVEVTRDELLAGYSRTADYTRKTQALATERKSLEQEVAVARKERAEYGQLVTQLRKLVEKGLEQEPDWAKLKAEDPVAFAVQREEWREKRERLQAVRDEEARVAALEEQEQAKEAEKILREERAKLLNDVLPHWKDAKLASSESKQIAEFMLRNGFSREELEVHDSRALGVLWKAWKYDQLQAKKPAAQQKVATSKVVTPGQKVKPTSAVQKARARLAKTGTVRDAAALFENFV